MTNVRPRIALTLARPSAFHGASHQRYRDALESAGADLVALHPGDPMPTDIDGLCLSGGGDIGHRPEEREGLVEHRNVGVRPGSRLAKATGGAPLTVNSRHHQAVTKATLGRGLVATVVVDDLVEAFELDDRRWVVGVQWHPERTGEVSPEARRIFEAFVQEAARTTTAPR